MENNWKTDNAKWVMIVFLICPLCLHSQTNSNDTNSLPTNAVTISIQPNQPSTNRLTNSGETTQTLIINVAGPQQKLSLKDYFPFVTVLLSAGIGTLAAYRLARGREEREETNRRRTALVETRYALHSQWEILEDIRKSLLEPFRNDPNRFQKQKYFIRTLGEKDVPFKGLTFIMESEKPDLLQEIHLAEKRFLSSIGLLEQVNRLRLEMHSKYIPADFDDKSGKGSITVPAHEVYALKDLVDLLYKEIDLALPDLVRVDSLIWQFIKTHFKGRDPVKFVPVEETGSGKVKP